MKKIQVLALVSFLFAVPANARDMTEVLSDIEKGSLELQATLLGNKAEAYDRAADNMPDAPSVEYSPFFHKGVSGVSSSELVVSQEFDFPSLYASRGKEGRLQERLLDAQYLSRRRDILLDAKEKCLGIVMLDEEIKLTRERLKASGELLALAEKRLKAGDATALEENRARLEHIDLQTELLGYETERQALADALSALGGNKELDLEGMAYPEERIPASAQQLQELLLADDAGLKAAGAAVELMRQEVKTARQGWIPKISVGYRRNTDGSEASNGFLVGAAFPLYSTGKRVKAAAARQASAELELDNSRAAIENEVRSLYHELRQLEKTMAVYDRKLLDESLRLLMKSVEAGSMNMTDYYTEADKIYRKRMSMITTENRYHVVLARINRNTL